MILKNLKNLWHLFFTPIYFKVTVICDYFIDFYKTFTDFDENDGSIGIQNPVYIYFKNSKSYSKFK